MIEDLVEAIRNRPDWTWTTDGTVATYRVHDWSATVRRPAIPTRPSHRWTVSVIGPHGAAVYSTWASTVLEAVRAAERQARAHAGAG